MAGAYPDVPGYRFAYDKDGTTAVYNVLAGGATYTVSSGDLTTMNQHQGAYGAPGSSYFRHPGTPNRYSLTLLFPEPRTITGYYMNLNALLGGNSVIATSTNTTNGQDGTWTTVVPNPYVYTNGNSIPVAPTYRTTITTVNWVAVSAVRFNISDIVWALHLYGSIPTTNSPDRLRIVDLSNNDIAAQLDFSDIRQRNNITKQFKVVNNSSTKTANNITVSLDTNPDASPSLIGQYQLSTDNTAYANAINIGTLAPGASSATLYVRDTVSATAQLGPWALRLIASANTWS